MLKLLTYLNALDKYTGFYIPFAIKAANKCISVSQTDKISPKNHETFLCLLQMKLFLFADSTHVNKTNVFTSEVKCFALKWNFFVSCGVFVFKLQALLFLKHVSPIVTSCLTSSPMAVTFSRVYPFFYIHITRHNQHLHPGQPIAPPSFLPFWVLSSI